MSRRGRRRTLDEKERALWDQVTRSVTPLRPQPVPADASPPEPEPAPPLAEPPARGTALRRSSVPVPAPAVPPLAALEPKARRRLARGAAVDARLDLHGLSQAAAHRRLRQFLQEAQAGGLSVVLVITGKGERGTAVADLGLHEGARGVLRRAVPLWLAEPDLRAIVVGFEEAGRRHGGEGALYVRIRRRQA
ncbi:Smr/MutS family protein [Xanthobacter tagetidis]|jgi:DNA-nicking Smr family endonuclease|uniref:DNA mismatch repair protein MutS n=1 Tax=Xanthobacter tagetidis TaxID=60216 RepID=A0A3L7AQC8_9HYPH|nr:Smr/MutS family protein [Xanthobacter tagetidis]MBB6308042.1 DNA-nicking Smr family endonuclease [Xanthobacter tagetidis]RLP81678.1 DNA mismatch repair protein MutS [Xanthobacter tagetidis]